MSLYISIYPLPFPSESKLRQTPGMKAKTHTGQVLTVDYQTKAVSPFRTVFTRQPVTKHSKRGVCNRQSISEATRQYKFSARLGRSTLGSVTQHRDTAHSASSERETKPFVALHYEPDGSLRKEIQRSDSSIFHRQTTAGINRKLSYLVKI